MSVTGSATRRWTVRSCWPSRWPLVAGLVSFFSPCVVPLLPGYLSYATGLSGADLGDARRGRMLAGSLLFVLGFSFVFVSFGALIGGVGDWLFEYQRQITSCSAA